MKKEKFSFVKWLTTRDIEKITISLGLEIMSKDNENKKRISRHNDEDGYHIIVFCKDLKQIEANVEKSKFLMGLPEFRNIATSMMMSMAMLAGASEGQTSFFEANNVVVLKFDDFFLQETLSLKSEDEQLENDRHMTKVYQKYMSQKFGSHYTDMKRAHYKKLYQQYREEEKANEPEQKL